MAKKERTAEEAAAKAARKAARKAGNPTAAPTTLTIEEKLEQHSPFVNITASLYLALSPCANQFPIQGLCAEHLSPNLLSYYPPLNGILLSYDNPRLSETPQDALNPDRSSEVVAHSINEYAVTFVWLTADFVLFRPSPGSYLKGEVNLQNEGVLGLIFCNYFNVAIPQENLPEGWTWDGEQWLNAGGQLDKEVVCKVVDFEPSGQESISITGTLVGL